jgi:5-methylcytosine-specific restriction endonuclease McrA
MDHVALVLAPWMAPHKLYQWPKSVCAALSGDADVLEEYDETISAPSLTMRIPAVLRLRKHMVRVKKNPKFSRANVYNAFRHTCAYCGRRFKAKELTYDHVIPRARGGPTNWSNIVPACGGPTGCNGKKDNRTPEEAGMRLLVQPRQPAELPVTGILALPREVPELWLPYLEGHRTLRSAG